MSKEIGLRKNSKISKKQLCVSQQEQEIDGKLSLIILAPELRSKLLPKRKKFKQKNKRMLTISARQMLIWKRERLDIKKRPRLKLRKKLLNLYQIIKRKQKRKYKLTLPKQKKQLKKQLPQLMPHQLIQTLGLENNKAKWRKV